MKLSESPPEPRVTPAPRPPTIPLSPPAPPPEAPFHLRYVALAALRERGNGPRNLFLGVSAFALALVLLGLAIFFGGARATLALGTCLLTFTALYVLARLHVFRQRHGVFLGIALVCLVGALLPLFERAFVALAAMSRTTGAAAEPAAAASPSAAPEPLPLVQAFALAPPDSAKGATVRARKDSPVLIEGRAYLIKAGDRFPLVHTRGGEVTVAVRDLYIALPAAAVEIEGEVEPALPRAALAGSTPGSSSGLAPGRPGETPAQITQRAQLEAMRRYPALAVKDSLENQAFVFTYREFKDSGGDAFFSDPEWPLVLAEHLAKREGWERGGAPTMALSALPSTALSESSLEDAPRGADAPEVSAREPQANPPSSQPLSDETPR